MSSIRLSWRDCRAFLADLDLHGQRKLAGQPVPHEDSCRSCAALLRSTVSQIRALRNLASPPNPDELSSPGFLQRIYERAGQAAETQVRPVLGRVLTRQTAPTDADWLAAEDAEEVAGTLAQSLPNGPAPGWLWMRIKSDVRAARIQGRRRAQVSRGIRVLGLLAASVLVSVLALRPFLVTPETPGEQELSVPRFMTVAEPLDRDFSPVDAIRGEER